MATDTATDTATEDRTARDLILDALLTYAQQRPALEFGNYANHNDPAEGRRSYFSECRRITSDLHQARQLLSAVRHSQITADELRQCFTNRLTWDGARLDYCTGQYWPVEYRPAVCRVLASALWAYYREHCGCETGDTIRAAARHNLPRAIAARWFN